MAEYQITYWREIPSMVIARDDQDTVKALLSQRFQEAIDEVAMRLDDISSDNYLEAWVQGPWLEADGSAAEVVETVSADLENEFSLEALTILVDKLGTPE